MAGLDEELTASLARAGLHGLSEADMLYLRDALARLQRPLPLPVGFDRTTAPAGFACRPFMQDIDD